MRRLQILLLALVFFALVGCGTDQCECDTDIECETNCGGAV
jgi:hypothetical protein